MSEADNQCYENLMLRCILHASEIDDTPEHYPAGLMRSWNRKSRQLRAASRELAAQRRPGRRGGRRIVRSATLTGAGSSFGSEWCR